MRASERRKPVGRTGLRTQELPAGRWPAIRALTQRTQRRAGKDAKKTKTWEKQRPVAGAGWMRDARSDMAELSGPFSVPSVYSLAKRLVLHCVGHICCRPMAGSKCVDAKAAKVNREETKKGARTGYLCSAPIVFLHPSALILHPCFFLPCHDRARICAYDIAKDSTIRTQPDAGSPVVRPQRRLGARMPSSRSMRTKPVPPWCTPICTGSRAICPTPATGIAVPDTDPPT